MSFSSNESKMVKEVTPNPNGAIQYKSALQDWERERWQCRELRLTEARSMFVDAKLTRHQYNIIRSKDQKRCPSCKKIKVAKKQCYTEKEYIFVTGTLAKVKLQVLLDHVASRLLQAQRTVVEEKPEIDWLMVHQDTRNISKNLCGDHNDACVFFSSLVLLRIVPGNPSLAK